VWYFICTLKEEYNLWVLKLVLKGTFRLSKQEVRREWRKMHNGKRNNTKSDP
jgi:hypothetical protein